MATIQRLHKKGQHNYPCFMLEVFFVLNNNNSQILFEFYHKNIISLNCFLSVFIVYFRYFWKILALMEWNFVIN